MKISGVVICALAVAASPAVAQTVILERTSQYRPAQPLPAYEVPAIVQSMDLMPVSRPVWTGDYYVVRAVDRRGAPVRVIVEGDYGRVMQARPVYAGRWSRRGRFGPIAPYYQERDPPSPPRGLRPSHASPRPSAAQRSAAIEPDGLPLPRPRPPLARDAAAPATASGMREDVTGAIAPPAPVKMAPAGNANELFPPFPPIE